MSGNLKLNVSNVGIAVFVLCGAVGGGQAPGSSGLEKALSGDIPHTALARVVEPRKSLREIKLFMARFDSNPCALEHSTMSGPEPALISSAR